MDGCCLYVLHLKSVHRQIAFVIYDYIGSLASQAKKEIDPVCPVLILIIQRNRETYLFYMMAVFVKSKMKYASIEID